MIRRAKRNRWHLVIALFSVVVIGFVLYFSVLRPYTHVEEGTEAETIDKEGDESEQYGTRLLYDVITRKQMQEITVFNGEQTYTFSRRRAADPTSNFVLNVDGKDFSHITFNDEKFSSLVVSVGTTYVEERLIDNETLSSADEAAREEIYAKYGLDKASSPAYFEVKRFEKTVKDGKDAVTYETFRVYVGNMTVSGTGYYLRYNNSHAVYVSNSPTVGTVVRANPAYYANLTLQASYQESGEYLMKDVTFWQEEAEEGAPISAEDTVRVIYARLDADGQPNKDGYVQGTINLRTAGESMAAALTGKRVGDEDITVTVPPEASAADQTEIVYHIQKIIAVDRLRLNYNFVNQSERDLFSGAVVYRFGAPASLVSYIANSDACMSVAELMKNFEATEIVELGVTDAVLEKYGLYAHTMYLEMPIKVTYSKEPGKENDYEVEGYLPNYLYFSDVTEEGTRYVASMVYDVVGVVDADTVSFLDSDYSHWIDRYMFMVNFNDVAKIEFDFGYLDHDVTYKFFLRHFFDEKGKVSHLVTTATGGALDVNAFGQVYSSLLNMQYLGLYEGDKTAVMADSSGHLLSLSVTLTDGSTRQYDFYAYSERHALVAINGEAHFFVQSPKIKKLASDILLVLQGEMPDYEKLY